MELTVVTVENDATKNTQVIECELKAGVQQVKDLFVAMTEDLKFVAAGKTAEEAVGNLRNGSIINDENTVVELPVITQTQLTPLEYQANQEELTAV
jgi:hypothetical protein